MLYYNLKVAVMLQKDVEYEATYEKISKLISECMWKDNTLKALHEENIYKLYTFCSLYPLERDYIYKIGKIYTFDIRFVQLEFAIKMKQLMSIVKNETFKVIMTNLETNEQRKISFIKTLTPAILTTDKGDYKIDEDMELVKKRILANTQKKYKQITGKETTRDFIKSIEKTNRTPVKIPYKNIFLLGNKFVVNVNEDKESQDLAYVALSTGLLEKNGLGFGFCKAK